MNYERPSAEMSSSDKDGKSSRSKSKRVAETLARTIAGAETPKPKAESRDTKRPVWDLGRFVGTRVVSEPRAEAKTPNPLDALGPRVENAQEERGNGSAAERAQGKKAADEAEPQDASEEVADAEGRSAERARVDDHELELAALQEDELPEVANRLIEPRLEEVREEQAEAEPDSVEAAAAEADAAFLEAVQAQVNDGIDLEAATAAAIPEVLGVDAPPLPEIEDANVDTEEPEAGQGAGDGGPGEPPLEALNYPEPLNPDGDDPYTAAYTTGSGGGGFGGGAAAGSGLAGGSTPGGFTVPGRWRRSKSEQAPRVEVSGVASGLLVGGIVGYLLGRRRGRIKTEKKLMPVQRELEKQVQSMRDHIAIREAQVRKLVWEHAAEQAASVAAVAEAARITAPEKKAEASAAKPEQARAKDLPLKQVLEISETIVVGSTTIRRVYETNLIEEAGLRRVVEEHLRGGDVHKVLTEELMIKELSYERDPLMNPRPDAEEAPRAVGGGTSGVASVNPLIQPPSASEPTVQPTAPPVPFGQQQTVSPALVLANIAALAILAVLLIILLIVWLIR